MSLKICFGQKQKLLGKLLWLVLWQSEWIIVMTQSGFSHWKYLKLCFAQGRISWRHMSRLQRIIGKPSSDFSDSKKGLQSHQVKKIKDENKWLSNCKKKLETSGISQKYLYLFPAGRSSCQVHGHKKKVPPWIPNRPNWADSILGLSSQE